LFSLPRRFKLQIRICAKLNLFIKFIFNWDRKEDLIFGGLVENKYPERLIYKFLGELFNLRKNRESLSESEYNAGVKNIIKKMKNIRDNDILTEVKEKTAALTKRFENRIQIENQKLEQLQEISKDFFNKGNWLTNR
jgi:hypothetical protein